MLNRYVPFETEYRIEFGGKLYTLPATEGKKKDHFEALAQLVVKDLLTQFNYEELIQVLEVLIQPRNNAHFCSEKKKKNCLLFCAL